MKKTLGLGIIGVVLVTGFVLTQCRGQEGVIFRTNQEGANTATPAPTPRLLPTATKMPFALVTVPAPMTYPGKDTIRNPGDGSECGWGYPPDPTKLTDLRRPEHPVYYICKNGKWEIY